MICPLLTIACFLAAPDAVRPAPATPGQPPTALRVLSDFEAGSARVLQIDQQQRTIRFSPAGDPQRGWPCWWMFRVEGITPGETLTLELTPAEPKKASDSFSKPDRAAFSLDGRQWRQVDEAGQRSKQGLITWRQRIDSSSAWFAWGPPFTWADACDAVQRLGRQSPHARPFELCRSREGRAVPGLVIREGSDREPRPVVWVQARQHAWETGASWTWLGMVQWLLGDDPRAKTLRSRAEIWAVPVMDVDNVAAGNGGKAQLPHDHNRDWSDQPHWPEVRAAQQRLKELSTNGQLQLFIDLHDPGAGSKQPFFFYPPDEILNEAGKANHARWLKTAIEEFTGPMGLNPKASVSNAKYDPKAWRQISKNWIVEQCGAHIVSFTLEVAWNTPHSTQEGYLDVGRQLGSTIERYLREAGWPSRI